MPNILTYNASSADNQQERVPKNIDNLKYYLAGFTDGEGSFSVTICKSKYAKLRWKIDPLFQVYQHKDNSLEQSPETIRQGTFMKTERT